MPTISVFYGIKIFMPPMDHNPPHFHVKYNQYSAIIAIKTGEVIAGQLPLKARSLTEEWRMLYVKDLMQVWNLLQDAKTVNKIPGLE